MHPKLQELYNQTLSKVEGSSFQHPYINYTDVLKAHFLISDYFQDLGEQIICGVKDLNILGSTLSRQTTGFGSEQKWKKPEEICATLFYGLIKNHPFHDANKRTALLTLIFHVMKYGKVLEMPQKEMDRLAVRVASDRLFRYSQYERFKKYDDAEVHFLAFFIRRHLRNENRKFYSITYHEFERLLNRFHFYFDNLNGNHVDIVKYVKKSGFLGFNERTEKVRIIQIGHPGRKRQVHPKALKEVLKACGLTAENGVDSEVFFNEAEPFYGLIDQYSEPLKRLRDK